jgi:hypothetical protein
MIWKIAIPKPRSYPVGLLTIVNFNLSKPHIILTKRQSCYREWKSFPFYVALFSFLHSCRESRTLVLSTCHLDLKSTTHENEPWWDPEDTIYFPLDLDLRGPLSYTPSQGYVTLPHDPPCQQFTSVRHIALNLHPLALWISYSPGGVSDLFIDVS